MGEQPGRCVRRAREMMKHRFLSLLLLFATGATPGGEIVERGTLRLHYLQLPIGYERYEVTRAGDTLVLSSDLDFTDRGGRIQLASTLAMRRDLTPIDFEAKGKTYRYVNVDAEVHVRGDSAHVR